MNIFSKLFVYAGKWIQKESRAFTPEEVNLISRATVVESQFGNSVCFFMKAGGQTFIPLSNDSTLVVGDNVDITKAQLLTLGKDGEDDIFRVKA